MTSKKPALEQVAKFFEKNFDVLLNKKSDLEYGFFAEVNGKNERFISRGNEIYSGLVWGTQNDASNSIVRRDEKLAIRRFISDSVWSKNVIEVGAGSGRVSRFIAEYAQKLTLVESEKPVVTRLKASLKSGNLVYKMANVVLGDFSKPLSGGTPRGTYGACLLLENLMGMNMSLRKRESIYRNVDEVLLEGGIAIFATRCRHDIAPDKIKFQVAPYDLREQIAGRKDWYGVLINWGIDALGFEFLKSRKNFIKIAELTGGSRPAGGFMKYDVFLKLPK